MKIKFFICVVVMMSAGSAFGIKTPSDAEIKDIQNQMYAANRMDKQIGDAKQKVLDAAKEKKSDADILGLKRQVEREKDKQSAARTKAIHMTILAYGLEPASWRGTSVMPSTKGRTITWMPVARESEARQVQRAGGALLDVKQDKTGYVGLAYSDGVTIMPPTAFEKGPGYLASILLHERIHFEQITTDGKGNVMSYAEAQKEAYKAQVDNGSYFFDVKSDKERKTKEGIEGLLATEVIKVEDEKKALIEARKGLKGLVRRFLPPAAPPDIFEAKVHTNAELADISGLVAQARAQADIARREREKREAIAQSAAEKAARRDHDERLESTINDMATRSVMLPGSVAQSELDKLPQRHAQDNSYMANTGAWESAYSYLHNGGRDAEELRRLSAPALKPVDALVPAPPHAVQPVRQTPAAPVSARTPFASTLPGLRELAVTACRSRGQVPIDKSLTHPSPPYSAWDERDARTADGLSAGLGNCEGRLFRRLIELIRAGQGDRVTAQWVQETAAQYRAEAGAAPGYTPPQTGRGDPCRDNGNIRCP